MQKPKIIMIIGLPGCGKSAIAQSYAEEEDYRIISSDYAREMLNGDADDRTKNNSLFNRMAYMANCCLKCRENVIIDATNLQRKKREHFLRIAKKDVACDAIAFHITSDLADCMKRATDVPESVMRHMNATMEAPKRCEGFDTIINLSV